jgi:hypothetical protein
MKKLVKVHELPTKDKSHIGLYIDVRGKLNIYYRNELTPQIKTFFPQHVYFISDEEPKDGDWFIRNVGSILAVEQYIKDDHLYANDRKIVATTDKALCYIKQNGHLGQAIIPLPQISQQFQEEYCKAGGKIDEVLLEYEWEEGEKFELDNLDTARFINDTELENCSGTVFNKSELSKAELDYVNYDKDALATLNLKTDQNNCVIIHPVEPKLYTRKEVERLCRNALHSKRPNNNICMKEDADNWIKENL